MSTATMRRGEADAATEFSARPIADFVKRVMAAREAKATSYVAGYLATCSKERLMHLGLRLRISVPFARARFRASEARDIVVLPSHWAGQFI